MICEDFNKNKNAMQGVRNLFEVKEAIGVEHAAQVATLLEINFDYSVDNTEGRIIKAIQEFITPEPEPVIDRSQL